MTGVWSYRGEDESTYIVSVSFPLRAPEGIVLGADPEHCPGSAAEPEAARGYFCIYSGNGENAFLDGDVAGDPTLMEPTSGRLFVYKSAGPGRSLARGAWAVTARCPIDP